MRIIHIWDEKRRLKEGRTSLVTFCGTDLRDVPKVSSEGAVHYAVSNIYRDEFIPDLCKDCLEYEGAQLILLAGTEL